MEQAGAARFACRPVLLQAILEVWFSAQVTRLVVVLVLFLLQWVRALAPLVELLQWLLEAHLAKVRKVGMLNFLGVLVVPWVVELKSAVVQASRARVAQ
jgi:hypothetical protein